MVRNLTLIHTHTLLLWLGGAHCKFNLSDELKNLVETAFIFSIIRFNALYFFAKVSEVICAKRPLTLRSAIVWWSNDLPSSGRLPFAAYIPACTTIF